jgi:hypothetical protein
MSTSGYPNPVSGPPAPGTPPTAPGGPPPRAAVPYQASGPGGPGGGPVPPGPPPRPQAWTLGRVVSLVLGIVVLVGTALVGLGAITLAIGSAVVRDSDGYLMSGTESFSTRTYALSSTSLEIHTDAPGAVLPEELLGDAKLSVRPAGDTPVFVGVAASSDADRYLRRIAHATVVGLDSSGPQYRTSPGRAPLVAPGSRDIWVARSSGTGSRTVTWPVERGDWTIVVMNADGSAGVRADISAGATVPALGWVTAALFVAAFVGLLLGLVLVVVPAVKVSRQHRRERAPASAA